MAGGVRRRSELCSAVCSALWMLSVDQTLVLGQAPGAGIGEDQTPADPTQHPPLTSPLSVPVQVFQGEEMASICRENFLPRWGLTKKRDSFVEEEKAYF